ncbi:MAG: hypothetical protein JST21_00840 [Bacteroidetes bacterium]|nr:hypothetical protein [Bacteroidota bacterium]
MTVIETIVVVAFCRLVYIGIRYLINYRSYVQRVKQEKNKWPRTANRTISKPKFFK